MNILSTVGGNAHAHLCKCLPYLFDVIVPSVPRGVGVRRTFPSFAECCSWEMFFLFGLKAQVSIHMPHITKFGLWLLIIGSMTLLSLLKKKLHTWQRMCDIIATCMVCSAVIFFNQAFPCPLAECFGGLYRPLIYMFYMCMSMNSCQESFKIYGILAEIS